VAQTALCILLLAGAGLLTRTLYNLKTLNAGFQQENILLVSLDTRAAQLSPERLAEFYQALLDHIRRSPRVLSTSYSTLNPADMRVNIRAIQLPGMPPGPEARGVSTNVASPEYFKTLGIQLLRGRDFSDKDRAGAPGVAVVNEAMARFYFDETEPIGRSFAFLGEPDKQIEIVGVVRDSLQRLRESPPRMVYVPWTQAARPLSRLTAEIRTEGDPRFLVASVQAEIRTLSKDIVVEHVSTMSEQVDATLVQERLLATLSTAFGGLALVLACIGLYGVMAYSVVRRTREMGIRMALGAARRLVLWQVLRESLWLVVLGVAIGLPLAVWAAPALGDLLYELSPTDPVIFLASATLLLVVAAVASYLPARRASRIEPAAALRHE
jgi:predicted permease